MKRKIFSILFALVLVLSLSLVTAVPAGAMGVVPDRDTVIITAADRLATNQNLDGGFAWKLPGTSATNCLGITAIGILKGHELQDKAAYETALAKAYKYVVDNPPVYTWIDSEWSETTKGVDSFPDATFLIGLAEAAAADATLLTAIEGQVSGTTSANISALAKVRWDGRVNHLGDTDNDEIGTATAMAEYIRDARHGQNYDTLIPWDLEAGVKAALTLDAYYSGQGYGTQATDIAGVIDASVDDTLDAGSCLYFDSTDDTQDEYVLGLTGAIEAFEEVGLYSVKASDLKDILVGIQQAGGYWNYYGASPAAMSVQSTAYAVMALDKQGDDDAVSAARKAADWLVKSQKGDGGWYAEFGGGDEYLEINSEAAWALATMPAPVTIVTLGYYSIQSAIDCASPSDTINVAAGTYTESLVVDTADLTLMSESGRDSTTIQNVGDAGGEQTGFLLMAGATNFTLGGSEGHGFTIEGGTGTAPRLIQLNNAPSGVEISHNEIDTTGDANTGINIGAAGATGLTVDKNIFIADEDATYQDWPLIGPDTANPVLDVTVTDNEFTGSGTPEKYGAAICLGKIEISSLSESTIAGNIISAFDRGIIISRGSSDLDVSGNDISNCGQGVLFRPDTQAEMENNIFANNTYNIYHAAEILTGGSSFYGNIQDAIDNADPADTIQVYAGTYDEYVDVNESLTLSGQPGAIVKPSTPVDAPIIGINADGVTVEGFEVAGTGLTEVWAGIGTSNGCTDVTIRGNTVHDIANVVDSGLGIGLWRGDGNIYEDILIEGNTIYNTDRMGIYIGALSGEAWLLSDNITIRDNDVYDTMLIPNAGETFPGGCGGIALDAAKNCTIEINTVYDTANAMPGIFLAHGSGPGNQILDNEVYNQAHGIAVEIDRGDVDFGTDSPTAPEVHFNNIHDNGGFGLIVLNPAGQEVNAEDNWWDAANGPSGEGSGDGDRVSTDVDYSPWLDAEYPGGQPTYPVVNDTTGEPYDSIQEAVDDALPGDTIIVGPGTYVGGITVSENMTLSAPDGAKLEGTGGSVVTIGDVTVTLEGFEIDPGVIGVHIDDDISAGNVVTIKDSVIYDNLLQGIWVEFTVYGTLNIIDCIIADNGDAGILINEVDDGGIVVIQGNKIGAWEDADYDFDGNDYGIYIESVYDGSSVTIGGATQEEANLVMENSNEGIYIYEMFYGCTLTIEGNVVGTFAYDGYTFDGNGYGVYIEYVDYGCSVTIKKNTIAGNYGDGVYIYQIGYDGSDPDWMLETEAEYYALFQTYGASNVTIDENMVVGNGSEGIYVYNMDFASTLTIKNNTVSENQYDGMYVAYFGNEGSTFYNAPAIYPAYFGPVVLIKGNTITDNEEYGIYCDEYEYGTSVTIKGNTISGNQDGGIYHCCGPDESSITIRGNTIVSNGISGWYGGIYMDDYIEDDSSYTVEGNFIAGNWGDGVYIDEVDSGSSLIIRGNTIGAGTDAEGYAHGGNAYAGVNIEYVCYDSTAEISRNTIAENGWDGGYDGIYIYEVYEDSSVSIASNNILKNDSDGIYIYVVYNYGSADIHYNNIAGNGDGVYYSQAWDSEYVDATNNWWGDKSGPSDYGPSTIGDSVGDYIIFSPWLTSLSVWEIKATLDSGWNTFSTPIALDGATDELEELGLDIEIAYGFINGDWVLITSDNDELVPCEAFYVKMYSGASIDLVPSPDKSDPTATALSQGWNLVGLANLSNMTAKKALATAYLVPGDLTGYDQIVSPEGNVGSWSYVRDGQDAPDMLPTEGYWVFMNNAGTLAGFTFTPISLGG